MESSQLIDGVRCRSLDVPDWPFDPKLRSFLSAEELARLDAFVRERDRRCYGWRTLWLRCSLAEETGFPPEAIAFEYGACGKPELTGPGRGRTHFNLSHADGYCLLAVSDVPVGVDLEPVASGEHWPELMEQVLHPMEKQGFGKLSPSQRVVRFAEIWTGKEAVLKAVGVGLSVEMTALALDFDGEDITLVSAPPLVERTGGWRIHSWRPAPAYLAALAVRRDR